MTTLTARDRRRDDTRAEVVAAAWRLAEQHGVGALSLREVAREVGMKAPSLYTYVASKGAIYDAMFVEGYQALGARMEAVALDPRDVLTSLTTAVEEFVAFGQESVARYQLMFTAAVPDWTVSDDAYAASLQVYGRVAERLASVGITEQDDLDLLLALMSGLAAQQLANEPGGDRWRRLARPAVEMFLAHHRRRTR
ncbi:hypothetical protein GCM10027446_03300 [Angustibacter peucedani]